MRTDLKNRPFPFTCHAVKKPINPFFMTVGVLVFVVIFVTLVFHPPALEGFNRPYLLILTGFWVFTFAMIPISAGFREVLPNRVVIARRATWVTPKYIPLELLLPIGMGVSGLASGVLFIHNLGGLSSVVERGPLPIVLGPVMVLCGCWLILDNLWQQLRGIRMTPKSITYWRGIGRVTVDWDEFGDAISTNDVRDHEGYRKHLDRYVPGAKIVVPVERVMDAKLRVHWEDADTPRLLLETDHFTVEPSALLTAILALRDNPELRPLLGTRESKVLFAGPPWRVRRHLYRTQQWWPAGAAPEGIAVDRDGVVKEFQ